MITAEQILSIAQQWNGVNPTLEQIQTALDGIDQNAMLSTEQAKLSYEVWDKSSSINGVTADKFLSRSDVDPNGEIYLIKENGNVLYFQPHPPNISGLINMDAETVITYAESHINDIATSRADAQVIQQVRADLTV